MTPFRASVLLLVAGVSWTVNAPAQGYAHADTRVIGRCLVLGFGRWLPHEPGWFPSIWARTPPPLQLAATRSPFDYWGLPTTRLIAPAPDLGADTVWSLPYSGGADLHDWLLSYMLYGWGAPHPDSLVLFDPAAADNGLDIRGVWRGEVLHARARSSTDVVSPEDDPRANAYAVQYPCGDVAARQRAEARLSELLQSDAPSVELNAREVVRERAWWDSVFRARRRP